MKRRDLLKGLFGGAVAGVVRACGVRGAVSQVDAPDVVANTAQYQFVSASSGEAVTVTPDGVEVRTRLPGKDIDPAMYQSGLFGSIHKVLPANGDYDYCDPDLSTHQFFGRGSGYVGKGR